MCMLLVIVPAESLVPAVAAEPVVDTGYITHEFDNVYFHYFTVSPQAKLTRQTAAAYLRFCLLEAYDHFGQTTPNNGYKAVLTYYDKAPANKDILKAILGDAIGYGIFRGLVENAVLETEKESAGRYRNTVSYNIPYSLIRDRAKVSYALDEMQRIVRSLPLAGKSDYEKIRIISQYICDNVTYVNDGGDCYTAYGALKNGQAVCDGYAHLTYAMMMEAGIDCAYIVGYGGGLHAWNIVQLEGLYYNLDVTWMDLEVPDSMWMAFFLRGATDFSRHHRDSEYSTEQFHTRYPMAATKYDGKPGTPYSCNGVHNYELANAEGNVEVYPTLTSPGKVLLTCAWCGAAESFTMPALNTEDYDYQLQKAATCTTDGQQTYWWLGVDGAKRTLEITQVIPATGHSYVNGICTACGVAGAHKWKGATCTEPATCTLCGATKGSALGHKWKDATCTAPDTCTVCGVTEGSALGHKWKEATCTAPKTCTVCGATQGKALPHKEVIDAAVPATCLKTGRTEGRHCTVCGTVTVARKTVPISGHTYDDGVDGTCNVCRIHREKTEKRTVMHMFRMYDPNSGEHFYTGSAVERDYLVSVGWNYEGVGFTFSRTTGMPVYRLYDIFTGEHLYTMEKPVKTALSINGMAMYECEGRMWTYEGIAFNSAYDTEVPQYRLRNPNATRGAYHFTASTQERDNLIAAGWIYEGIGFYTAWN